jgi:ComF family protein
MIDNYLGRRRCPLCHGPCIAALCQGCEHALPWNTTACPGCARPQLHDAPCADCARQPPPFDRAWAALRLETPVRESIHTLKYHAGFLQAHWLGELMAQRLARRPEPLPQVLIPVPLHHTRLMRRGYDQAQELARVMTRSLAIPLRPLAAKRMRATPHQVGLSEAQRRKNVRQAFAVDASVRGLHIALLDDVMTTGATLHELALSARKAGAVKIEVWAAARA